MNITTKLTRWGGVRDDMSLYSHLWVDYTDGSISHCTMKTRN